VEFDRDDLVVGNNFTVPSVTETHMISVSYRSLGPGGHGPVTTCPLVCDGVNNGLGLLRGTERKPVNKT